MKNAHSLPLFAALVALTASTAGCQAIGDIFKAGIWVGVVVVGIIVALVFGATRLFAR
jgi:hypothetical protein